MINTISTNTDNSGISQIGTAKGSRLARVTDNQIRSIAQILLCIQALGGHAIQLLSGKISRASRNQHNHADNAGHQKLNQAKPRLGLSF